MYRSTLVVTTPAATPDLTDLATAKDELGIADSSGDVRLGRWITEASDSIARYVGRPLRAEGVTETFTRGSGHNWQSDPFIASLGYHQGHGHRGPAALRLSRFPVSAVTSITEDGNVLVAGDDFALDAEAGLLYRASGDIRIGWAAYTIEVAYTAGWAAIADIPTSVSGACLTLLTYRSAARGRDPALRTVIVPGVSEKQYYQGGTVAGSNGTLPADVAERVDYLRDVRI